MTISRTEKLNHKFSVNASKASAEKGYFDLGVTLCAVDG